MGIQSFPKCNKKCNKIIFKKHGPDPTQPSALTIGSSNTF